MIGLALLAAAHAGDITGTVSVARLSVGSQARDNQEVVVYLEGAPLGGAMPEPPFRLAQRGKRFDPSLLIVPVGARVEFPNYDPFSHNVFSVAPAAPFDLGLYATGESRSLVFEHPGVVPVYCNIHPQMVAHVLVVENRWFTRLEDDGRFTLEAVPPGTYELVAWFPFGEPKRQVVRVETEGATTVSIVLQERHGHLVHDDKHGRPYGSY